MPQIDNYEVWICVDGERLPEYGVHYSGANGKEITCWIPSEVGKAFEICYKDSIRAFATGLCIFVDGTPCAGRILPSRQASDPLGSDTITQNGVPASDDSYRPFIFSNCQLTDEDEFVSSCTDPGQITIHVDKLAVGKKSNANACNPFPNPKVHERTKKGIVHGIQLGPECFEKRGTRIATRMQRFVTFKFKYRPLDVLRADDIVPRSTPSNAKATLDRDAEEARIQALKEELRVLEARQHEKKRKRSDSNLNVSLQRIKRERSLTLDNNVIDLTEIH